MRGGSRPKSGRKAIPIDPIELENSAVCTALMRISQGFSMSLFERLNQEEKNQSLRKR